jgi:hypothetical protein
MINPELLNSGLIMLILFFRNVAVYLRMVTVVPISAQSYSF